MVSTGFPAASTSSFLFWVPARLSGPKRKLRLFYRVTKLYEHFADRAAECLRRGLNRSEAQMVRWYKSDLAIDRSIESGSEPVLTAKDTAAALFQPRTLEYQAAFLENRREAARLPAE